MDELAGALAWQEITCSMDFKKQWPDPPFFFEKEQVISCRRFGLARDNLLYGFQKTMARPAILF